MAKKQFRDFESAREFARGLGFKSQKEWRIYRSSGNKPIDIPADPQAVYQKNFKSWGDWLGTGNTASQNLQYRSYESAREFVRDLGLKNRDEWIKYSRLNKKPIDIPAAPWQTYKNNGWNSIGDWLGTGRIANQDREYLSFDEAKKLVMTLGLKNQQDWYHYIKSGKKPQNIPSVPERVYRNIGWSGLGDWLGTGNISPTEISKKYLPFSTAREQVRDLAKKYKIKNWKDWDEAVKKGLIPKYIPANPNRVYSKKRKKNEKKAI